MDDINQIDAVTEYGEMVPFVPRLPGTVARAFLKLPNELPFERWKEVGEELGHIHSGINWWVGDWWNYAGYRHEDKEKFEKKLELVKGEDWEGPRQDACEHAGWVSSRFRNECRRRHSLPYAHHLEVASLPEEEADRILDWAEAPIAKIGKPRSRNEVRAKVSKLKAERKRESAKETAIVPVGKYSVIVIDPPWDMEKIERDIAPNQTIDADGGHVAFEYPTMSEEELQKLDIGSMAYDDCHIFCWTTVKYQDQARMLIEAWGFRYISYMVWHKSGGFQPYGLWQFNFEPVLYGRRGAPEFVETKAFMGNFHGARREHSRKPDEFYDTIKRVTDGPRIDVFSREARDGFDQFGNEVNKFAGE